MEPSALPDRAWPVLTAKTGLVAGDVIDILDAESQVCQRADAPAFRRNMSVAAEGSKIVLIKYRNHRRSTGKNRIPLVQLGMLYHAGQIQNSEKLCAVRRKFLNSR